MLVITKRYHYSGVLPAGYTDFRWKISMHLTTTWMATPTSTGLRPEERTRMLKQHEGWLVVTGTMEFDDFPYICIYIYNIYIWEFHHPNWRTPWFFRGVAKNHQPVRITWHSSWRIWFGKWTKTWWRERILYPLVMSNIAIENGPVEIVDLPISMVIFHSFLYVYRRVHRFLYGLTHDTCSATFPRPQCRSSPWGCDRHPLGPLCCVGGLC